MTQLTRRNVLLLAVVMAAATTFVAYLFLTRQQVQAHSLDTAAPRTMVVVARQPVRPLQTLRGDWFAVKEVKADGVPRDAIATPADLNGKVALVTMAPGQVVTAEQIATPGPDLGLAFAVKPPLRAVTVALDPIIGVAGFPKPGNHVDVLATFSTDYGMVTRTVLQDVEILALGSEAQPKEVDPDSGKTSKAVPQVTATLAVLPGEAEKLVLAENRGKLQLALRAADDTTYRSRTGSKELAVTGEPVRPKDGATLAVVTKTAPAPAATAAANQYLRDADRLIREAQAHPAPPPVLPPVSAPLGETAPAPRSEDPGHVITVIQGDQVHKVLIKHDRKPGRAGSAPGVDAGPTPTADPVTEAQ